MDSLILLIMFSLIGITWIYIGYKLDVKKEPKTQEERIRKIIEDFEGVGKKYRKEAKEKNELEDLKNRVSALEDEYFYNKQKSDK